jgi:hypothetical protein
LPAVDLQGAQVSGDVSIRFGLTAAPTNFRRLVENFVKLYLGTAKSPVPFGGRDREIAALNGWLDNRSETSLPTVLAGDADSNNLLITAPAGRGKTALLIRWIQQLDKNWRLAFIPVSIRAETNQALTFYQAFAARLAEILGEPLPEPRADPAAYYRDKVSDYLDRIGKGSQNCLVVIDGLDEARGWKTDTAVLPTERSPRLKIVVSARELAGDNACQDWLERLGWTPPICDARTLQVQPLDREGIADVLAKMEFPVGPLSKDVDIIDELFRLTEGGDPLVLQFYANDLLRQGKQAARLKPTDLRRLQPGFGAYIKRWLEEQKVEWKATGLRLDDKLVDAMLAVLASAFGPLRLSELEELIGRVFRGNHVFSVRTVEPLRRFIVGDGKKNGYALAHPKLANFLQHDYFVGSKILRDSQEAFVAWIREWVQTLNEGRRSPEDTPTYALLFYTQHLNVMGSGAALELYRELVENGWRKAWQHHESGFQGFSRDIELAARAFRDAADLNPAQLRKARIGLGAQVRCALCLSSIRSTGFGATGEVLAEFLRSQTITPKQALYLAQLKEDKDRANTIKPIIELLPAELRLEVYVAASDIGDPEARFDVLLVVALHLTGVFRERAYLDAFRASKLLKTHRERSYALTKLESFIPVEMWTKAKVEEEARGLAEAHAAQLAESRSQTPQQDPSSATAPPAEAERDSFYLRELAHEASRVDLSQDQIREILIALQEAGGYTQMEAMQRLAPRLSRELQILALEAISRGKGRLFRGEALEALVPFLANDLLDEVVRFSTTALTHDLEKPLSAVANRLDAEGMEKAFQHVFDMNHDFHRKNALGVIAPHLPETLLAAALRWSLNLEGYYRSETVAVLLPHLTFDEAVAVIRSGELDRAKLLLAVMPKMPNEFLPEAVKLAAQIFDTEQRGRVLAVLLPRLREAELSTTIADAYLAAFVIGDSSFRTLAQAAVIPYLEGELAESCISELSTELSRTSQSADDFPRFVLIMALTLTSAFLSEDEAAKMLDQAIAYARDFKDDDVRPFLLGILSARLSGEQGKALLKEAVDLARMSGDTDQGITQALLATFLLPEEIPPALESLRKDLELNSTEQDRRATNGMIGIVMALFRGTKTAEIKGEVSKGLRLLDDSPQPRDWQCLLPPLLVLLLAPELPIADREDLLTEINNAIDNLEDSGDPEIRVILFSLILPYLPTTNLWVYFRNLLDAAARSPRLGVFTGLALAQGLVSELFKRSPATGGNRIPGSPVARLGGPTAVTETMEAIRDVSSWWP